MEEQPTLTELLNKITFLKQALQFYANEKNYIQNVAAGYELCSRTELDNGAQARFALEQIEELEKYNRKMIKDYLEALDGDMPIIEGETPEERMEKLQEKITQVYKTIDKYGNKNV